eukprot:TRINITY_DN76506_c0_g1_i1.p1 TRINITY_DN76506_c0_g1~~TRINITY_DN76506_c0_g1_i1.p1  ORF type:complete len:99 (+),score=11.38 TRINITY_DN76506_c0_g1_i1:94-390(+)
MGWYQNMGARLNKDIEYWAHYRENTHRYFKITRRNLFLGIVWLGIIPYGIFKLSLYNQIELDERNKRTVYEYLGGPENQKQKEHQKYLIQKTMERYDW